LKKAGRAGQGFGFGNINGASALPFQDTGDRIARYGKGFSNLLNLAQQSTGSHADQNGFKSNSELGHNPNLMTHANTYANNSDDDLAYGDQSYRTLNPAEALHKYREGGNPQASTVIGGMIDNFELSHRKLQRRGERNINQHHTPGMSPKKMKP